MAAADPRGTCRHRSDVPAQPGALASVVSRTRDRNNHAAPGSGRVIQHHDCYPAEPNSSGSPRRPGQPHASATGAQSQASTCAPGYGPSAQTRLLPYIRAFIWCSAHVAVVVVVARGRMSRYRTCFLWAEAGGLGIIPPADETPAVGHGWSVQLAWLRLNGGLDQHPTKCIAWTQHGTACRPPAALRRS
jgi:hypothetical protein